MADELSADVRQFIEQNIESIAQLESLLLLREDPARQWGAAEMAKALYVPTEMAASLLAGLQQRGFLKAMPSTNVQFSYRAADPDADQLLGQAIDAYQHRRVAVISLIYSRPINKVQTFADAFRLRQENSQ